MIERHIVLVRHGMPVVDQKSPASEWLLSKEGILASKSLANALRAFSFEFIATSPEPKAFQTAQCLASQLGELPIKTDSRFSEHARSSTAILSPTELVSGINDLFDNPHKLVFGEETASQIYTRFCAALDPILAYARHDIIVVSHGTIISSYVGRMMQVNSFAFWQQLGLPTAVVLSGNTIRLIQP